MATVQDSPDFRRIISLPRRVWSQADAEGAASAITDYLRRPGGTQTLYPHQGQALWELGKFGKLLGALPVGTGKTLISYLAADVLGASRPVLLIPGGHREKTLIDFSALAIHWRLRRSTPPRILSYEELSRKGGDALLRNIRPDLVIADEAHRASLAAAVTTKIDRYREENQHAYPMRWAPLSGTFTRNDAAHLGHHFSWSLGEGSPFPVDPVQMGKWDEALRVINPCRDLGILRHLPLANHDPSDDEITRVRKALGERITQTEGVTVFQGAGCPASLNITAEPINPSPGDPILYHWAQFREAGILPDGLELVDALEFARYARQLSHGYFSRWNPRPPEWWLLPRKAYGSRSRAYLDNHREVDTFQQVDEIAAREHWQEWHDWVAVRSLFTPQSESVWVSDFAVKAAAKWAKDGGVIWTNDATPFAERISVEYGFPYFGAGASCQATGENISQARHKTIVASVNACGEGQNVQQYSRALLVSPFASSRIMEQLLGRHHRIGQLADSVDWTFHIRCYEHAIDLDRVLAETPASSKLFLSTYKLELADKIHFGYQYFVDQSGPQWTKER